MFSKSKIREFIDERVRLLLAEHESDMEITVRTLANYNKADRDRIVAMAEAKKELNNKIATFERSTGESVTVEASDVANQLEEI